MAVRALDESERRHPSDVSERSGHGGIMTRRRPAAALVRRLPTSDRPLRHGPFPSGKRYDFGWTAAAVNDTNEGSREQR